jgi:hypothetical protein
MPGFRRLFAAIAISSAVLWLGAGAAEAAGNPGRTVLPAPPDLTGPFCGAALGDVLAHVSIDREYIKTYTNSAGVIRLQVEGFQQDVFTVLRTGKTISINASGPAVITIYPSGAMTEVLQGRTAYLVAPPGVGLFLITGLAVFDTSTGSLLSSTGNTTDLCSLLT